MTELASSIPPRRKPWIAALLALFFGPVAQVYCGRLRRAIVLELLLWIVSAAAFALMLYLPMGKLGLALGIGLLVGFYLYVSVDAVRLARNDSQESLRGYQRWWIYLAIIIANACVSELSLSLNRRYWSEAFILNGGSMKTTLYSGDRFMIDKLALRMRPLNRGEIVAYRTPTAPETILCHRIVGVPGDRVEIRDEQLLINDEPLAEPYALFEGELPPYEVIRNFEPQTVPPGHYFILGDNRRAAKDSRFEGFVPIDDVVGVARVVFWSREYSEAPSADPRKDRNPRIEWGPIRWSRIGQRLD